MALGAIGTNIVGLVLRRALLVAGLGVLAGLAASAALSRMLSSFLYGVSPLNPLIFGSVLTILIFIAVTASYFPALRATRIEPTEALRAE